MFKAKFSHYATDSFGPPEPRFEVKDENPLGLLVIPSATGNQVHSGFRLPIPLFPSFATWREMTSRLLRCWRCWHPLNGSKEQAETHRIDFHLGE